MQTKNRRFVVPIHTFFWGLLLPGFMTTYGLAEASFYEGKTITIIRSSGAGGVGDLRTRAFVQSLRKHIPGNPSIAIQYMPGGGGRKAANYLYNVARPDGLTLVAGSASITMLAIQGAVGVEYDTDRFIYLGAPMRGTSWVFLSRSEFNTLEKLRSAPKLRLGGQTVGHSTWVITRLFAYLLGLKDATFIAGYTGPELDVAMVRGEIDGRATNAAPAVAQYREWISKGVLHFHAFLEMGKGEGRHSLFAELPELESFAVSSKEQRLLALYRSIDNSGSPSVILPPGTPKERVKVLRAAMRRTFEDPEFYGRYKKLLGEDPNPVMPEEAERLVREIPREPEVIELIKKLSGPESLPGR